MKKIGVLAVMSVMVMSCSKYSSNGEYLYLQSRNGEKVVVPAPLTRSNISDFYDLPAQNQDAKVSIEPPIEDLKT